jgi:chromosome segregation ATPase
MAKIQFNSKSFNSFRAIMGQYHSAEHATKDYLGSLQDTINGDMASLSRNNDALEKLLAGDKSIHETEDSLRNAIAQFEKQLEDHKEDRKQAQAKKVKAEEDAVAMVTKELYDAYKTYIECKGDGDADAYAQAIAEWFMSVQTSDKKIEVYPSGCMGYIGLVGSMNDNKSQKTGMLRKAKTKATFTQEWLKTLADNLQLNNIIAPHKYAYIPVRMRGKDEK